MPCRLCAQKLTWGSTVGEVLAWDTYKRMSIKKRVAQIFLPNGLSVSLCLLHSDVEKELTRRLFKRDAAPITSAHNVVTFRLRPVGVFNKQRVLITGSH